MNSTKIESLILRFKNNELLQNTTIVFFSNVLNRGVLFLIYFFVAKSLSLIDYGIFTLCLAIGTTISSVSNFTINASVTRYTARLSNEVKSTISHNFKIFLSTFLINNIVIGILLTSASFFFSKEISSIMNIKYSYDLVQIASIGIFCTLIQNYFQSLFTGLQKFKKLAIINLIPSIILLSTISISYLFGFYNLKLNIILFSVAPIFICVYLIFDRFIKNSFILTYNLKLVTETASFGKWMTFQGIILIIQSKLDLYYLTIFTSLVQLSYFDIANKLQGLMLFGIGSLSTVLLPKISSLPNFGEMVLMKRRLSKALTFISIIIFIYSFTVPFIMDLFFGNKYFGSKLPFLILSLSLVPHLWTLILHYILFALGESKFLFTNVAIQLILNIIISFFLVPHLGAVGSSTTYFIIQIFSFTFSYWYFQKCFKKHN